jgi:crossover junction endodeoxyribonuclease RuvC
MRVLGLDPSLRSTGYGVIEFIENRYAVHAYGTIKPGRSDELPVKLLGIKSAIDGLIARHSPEEVAVENPFYARNIKTALVLGQVRGAVLVAVAGRGLPLFEYSPLEIKKAVTSYGQAEKDQVNAMVRTLLGIEEAVEEDASDALACAFCHLNTRMFQKLL